MIEITIPSEILKDREFGPACWLLSCDLVAHMAWKHVDLDRRRVDDFDGEHDARVQVRREGLRFVAGHGDVHETLADLKLENLQHGDPLEAD